MLALRLTLGSRPFVLARRLCVAAAAAGTGFLLLATLGHAAARPAPAGDSLVRLIWCAVPLAATAQLAVSVARTDPASRPRQGMTAAGLGPLQRTLLAATLTTLSCALGVLLALLVFLHLRGDLGGAPALSPELLGTGAPLPFAAALLLLALVPLTAAAATAVALRPRTPSDAGTRSAPTSPSLPWGIALTAAGLALESYASRVPRAPGDLLPLPGRLVGIPFGVLAGWTLTAAGLVLAGPGLVQLSGRLLCARRPGALRLLAGRVLEQESARLGRPLGVLCAALAAAYAAVKIFAGGPSQPFGPLSALGAAVVLVCVTISALTAVIESRAVRTHTAAALRRLGAPASLLRRTALLRALALVLVLAPLTWLVAELAALPLR